MIKSYRDTAAEMECIWKGWVSDNTKRTRELAIQAYNERSVDSYARSYSTPHFTWEQVNDQHKIQLLVCLQSCVMFIMTEVDDQI